MDKKRIIEVLREKRRSEKRKIQDVAKELGVHRNTLGRIESGETDIVSYDLLCQYAQILGMELILTYKA